ncbi:MAG: ABC transporter ATP-binding protein [Coriobacteriaceae bacterium]|nr:ABC transporter ATP-binding protein [Coriobacteriaceae bacterium]
MSSPHSAAPSRPPHGPHGPRFSKEKAKDFKGTMRRVFGLLSPHKLALLVIFVFAIGGTAFNIVGPKVLSTATTEVFEGAMAAVQGTGGIDFDAVARILLATLSLYLLSALCSFVQIWLMTGMVQRLCYKLREDINLKIDRMPFGYFERNSTGDTLSRITNDVDTMGQTLAQSVVQLVTGITTVAGVLVMMLLISPLMTLVALLIIPVSLALVMLIVKRSQKYFFAQQEVLGEVNGIIEESFAGQGIIKAFNAEQRTLDSFADANRRLYEAGWKSQFAGGLMKPVMDFVGNLGYVAVALMGGWLAVQGAITVGDIQAFIQYVKNFTQPLSQMSQVGAQLQQMAAAAERVFEFLSEDEEADWLAEGQPPVNLGELRGAVSFEEVSFGYAPGSEVIRGFSARVEPGQTVALVGPTGAGKTTMVKLLMRFYDVSSGCIRIDGRDLRTIARPQAREMFGMVLQDTWLFGGTIRENIRYGRLDATDEEVEEAARAGCADHFIRTLPGGYDYVINEDSSNVSQGQRQLLTIARAILANRPMLILDEATSSVDTRTEERIQEAMDRLMEGRTSFVIAHRLSTIRNADLILVMRDGDVAEQGTHEELLAKGGFYAELYNSQFEGCE